MPQKQNQVLLLAVGVFVLVIGGVIYMNSLITQEIEQVGKPAAEVAPVQPVEVVGSNQVKQAGVEKEIMDLEKLMTRDESLQEPEKKEEKPRQPDKKIYYEMPLDDVILVQ